MNAHGRPASDKIEKKDAAKARRLRAVVIDKARPFRPIALPHKQGTIRLNISDEQRDEACEDLALALWDMGFKHFEVCKASNPIRAEKLYDEVEGWLKANYGGPLIDFRRSDQNILGPMEWVLLPQKQHSPFVEVCFCCPNLAFEFKMRFG